LIASDFDGDGLASGKFEYISISWRYFVTAVHSVEPPLVLFEFEQRTNGVVRVEVISIDTIETPHSLGENSQMGICDGSVQRNYQNNRRSHAELSKRGWLSF
jgi:hypothetical protein